MKFTDGNWMMRKGVRASYAAEAYEIASDNDSLTVFAPTKNIRHRGDTLDGPLLTIRFSSPMADVVKVNIAHFSGEADHGPAFCLFAEKAKEVAVNVTDDAACLSSGRLTAKVARKGDWAVDFLADGASITRSGPRGIGLAQVEGEGPYIHEQLSLKVGECVYGFGERFTAFVKNGQVVETWNKDGGTGSDQAYKCIPFYFTNRGYGVFVNSPSAVSYEVASEKVSRVQFSVPGESLEYFVIYGPTPREILEKYTALTGRPALPPAWSFGLWLTTSFTTSYDEATCTSFIQGMADRDLPLHVFHFDCFWMKAFHWCDFTWDTATFPDPRGMLARLKEKGLRICVWINPYIAQLSPLFAEGREHGYLLKKPDGDVWQTDQWQAGMGIVDFTNPAACVWFQEKLRALLDMGVDAFKTDFGERIPIDVQYHDGSDPVRMHNFYTYLYNKAVFDLLQEHRGVGEATLFARSATAGGQQFPVHWGGDCYSTFESMAESLRGGLSLCSSGFGFWSHDIGGFEGTPPFDVYKRWIAFGLLSSHSRLHGSSSYRVPWLFDDEACDVLRHFTKLKCRLMPYLYGRAVEASRTGMPLMRAMPLEFPGDPACDYLDRQYMLGEALLAAPLFSGEGDSDFYVPHGRWTDFATGAVLEGPGWKREKFDFMSIPLLVRPNSIVAVGMEDKRPDYEFCNGVTLRVYELADGHSATASVPTLAGEIGLTVTISRLAGKITIEAEGDTSNWKVLLVNIESVKSVTGGKHAAGPGGTLITPESGVKTVTVGM
jgi:alpha-D-xyloside xylohydrolase